MGRLTATALILCSEQISTLSLPGNGKYVTKSALNVTELQTHYSVQLDVVSLATVYLNHGVTLTSDLQNLISRGHSFPRAVEFRAEPRNSAVAAEFSCFRGISRNSVATAKFRKSVLLL